MVNETSRADVSLYCIVSDGNPKNLTNVQWYFNKSIMYNTTNSNHLLLKEVGAGDHGNYSCAGKTMAGWGPASEDKEVFVQSKYNI